MKIIAFERSFASHPRSTNWSEKNTIQPENVTLYSQQKFWFNCIECGHDFQSTCANITNGKWCPYCANKKLCDNNNCQVCFQKSFASHDKAHYWSNRNTLTPRQVFKNSAQKYWFNCDKCNHEFQSTCCVINSGHWCPYCSNPPIKLCECNNCEPCFQKSFASHDKVQCWSSKNTLSPRQVFKNSHINICFVCDNCNHEFQSTCHSVNSGHWCQYCTNRQLCDNDNCEMCFLNSFASHTKAQCWSNKNTLTPRQVCKNSAQKYWFNCDKCNHEFQSSCANINSNQWCPYCSNPPRLLCDTTDCMLCFQKSFASHDKAQYWSDKNTLSPRQIFKNSNQKFWFKCNNCNHEFQSTCNSINYGQWCPYCANPPQQLCTDNTCEWCFQKSFASHAKAPYWSNKNTLSPREVFKNSQQKCWFNCDKCNHLFESTCCRVNSGQWCPKCKNKTEAILFNKLKERYPSLICQFKTEWCKNKRHLPFDFLIPEHKIIIELDGLQHFVQVSNWKSPEIIQEIDQYKMKCANDNGYVVIRVLQEDVYENKFDWLSELLVIVNKIVEGNLTNNFYICKNNEYDIYNK